jgi:spore coat polysaccharide biosynthesis predicted glycosyltransferase SpsG
VQLVIRADATPAIGAGHVMRCATLAEAWIGAGLGTARMCGEVTLAFAARRVRDIGAVLATPADAGTEADVLVVDSYDVAVRQDAMERRAGLRVVVDDVGDPIPRRADVVWNPNPYGRADLYPGFVGRLLTGDRCVPIRPSLPAWGGAGCAGTAVALGGSEPTDALRAIVVEAVSAPGLAPVAGVGSWVPTAWASVDVHAPWGRLASCCRALVGAGTSTWEAAAIGIPAVVAYLVPNQRLAFEWARAVGAAMVDLTDAADASATQRLRGALGAARPLPAMRSGAGHVAMLLHRLARNGART